MTTGQEISTLQKGKSSESQSRVQCGQLKLGVVSAGVMQSAPPFPHTSLGHTEAQAGGPIR